MAPDLREFLGEFQRGIEVCVADSGADTLFGVRDAFRRFFRNDAGDVAPVAVVPQEVQTPLTGLPLSDVEAIARARRAVDKMESELSGVYHFYLAAEACYHSLDLGAETPFFVRSWAVLRGVAGETLGSSGSLQLPPHLVDGLGMEQLPHSIPGTRRSGGIVASLTGGLESRRTAVAEATLHALSTQFFGILDTRRTRR
jgi:non-canonical (house-cleaning) NTP pyrophosphatase